MQKYTSIFKKLKEDSGTNVQEIIKELISTKWSQSEDKGKALSLFKGLMFSDSPSAKKFISDLDDSTDKMDLEAYKEDSTY